MAASVLTSHAFGPAKLIFDAGGTEPAKLNIRTDPFAIWTCPFAKYMYIYIYVEYYPTTTTPPLYPTPPPPTPRGWGGAGRGGVGSRGVGGVGWGIGGVKVVG